MPNPRLFACDTQPILLEGLRRVLADGSEIDLVGVADSLESGIAEVEATRPDAVLIDHAFGVAANIRFLAQAVRLAPETRTLIWGSRLESPEIRFYRDAGVAAVADKTWPVDDLRECLVASALGNEWRGPAVAPRASGHRRLTPRELEIAKLVCNGMNNRQVADSLLITPGTVKVHLMHVFEKTGARDRFELALHRWRFFEDTEAGSC